MRRTPAALLVLSSLFLLGSCNDSTGPADLDPGTATAFDPGAGTAAASGASQLVINEVLADPDATTDDNGEWVEVHNWGTTALDLQGWTIRSGNDAPHTVSTSVPVPAGGYALLARSGNSKRNGGLSPDYVYGSAFWLANSADWLALDDPAGVAIDSVAWSTVTAGVAHGVIDPSVDNASMSGGNWQAQGSSFGRGKNKDYGTPGAQNDGFVAPQPVVATVEVSPTAASIDEGGTQAFAATAYDASGGALQTTFTWNISDAAIATVDASGLATAVAAGTAQIRATADNGVYGEAALTVTVADTTPPGSGGGDIVINEIMPNPSAVTDADGEWFELHNAGSSAVDLQGWTVQSNNDGAWTISTSLVIPAGGYATFARSGDSGVNGGLTVDFAYGTGMTLANSADWLAVRDGSGATVDSVAWSSVPTGATRGVSDPTLDNTNANGANWHTATSTYGAGDQGTPGAENDGYVGAGGGTGEIASVTVSPASASATVGGSAPFTASATDAGGSPVAGSYTWSSSNTAVATVDGSGVAAALAEGTALIRATAGNGVYDEATLTVTAAPPPTGAELVVKVLDIGQGDATYIQNGASRILIDGGPSQTAFGDQLDALGLNNTTIDVVIISHAHFDHYSGLRELFETARGITVRYVFENMDAGTASSLAQLRDSIGARASRGELIYRDTDDPCLDGSPTCTIYLDGGAKLHILRPDPSGNSVNNRSAAVKLVGPDSASFSMWFAGDAEHEEIGWFDTGAQYDIAPGMDIDVLKSDHHGSCNGLTRRYIELLSPDWATMSVSSSNSYGLVHDQTKALLSELSIPWYRTDENGTITFRSPGTPGGGYTVSVERGGSSMNGAADRASAASDCQSL